MPIMAKLLATAALVLTGSLAGAATSVSVRPLSELLMHPLQSAPASVQSLNDSRISAQLLATIAAIDVRVGDRVTAGQRLLRLDCRSHRAELLSQQSLLAELQSQLKFADAQLQRARALRAQRNISDEQVEQRQTELGVLTARIGVQQQRIVQAKIQVERCQIDAPFDGVILERLAHVGELAEPGSRLLRLQQLDALEVTAQLRPEQHPQDSKELYFDYRGQRFPVTLRRLLPVLDGRTRSREARFEFSGAAAPPGAAGRLNWRATAGYLPAHLLVQRSVDGDPRLGVLLLEAGRARFHPLPEAIEGQDVQVRLATDSLVIVEGRHGLGDGDSVRVEDQDPAVGSIRQPLPLHATLASSSGRRF